MNNEVDKEMIELVGHGIAMGNAIQELKDVADEITDSVVDDDCGIDGVAEDCKQYCNEV